MGNESELGILLESLRKVRRLSRRALALRAGVSHTTIGNWESGFSLPRLPELLQVLVALESSSEQQQRAIQLLERPRALVHLRRRYREAPAETPVPLPLCQGDLLRALRARRGWTLERVAERLGVAARTVSRWERGELLTTVSQRHAFCRALQATPDEVALLTVENVPESESSPATLEVLHARFDSLWQANTPYQAALLELGYLSLAVHIQSSSARQDAAGKQFLMQVYAALANRYYITHQHDRASAFAAQAIRLLDAAEPLSGLGVVALARFAQTSPHHALSEQILARWTPRCHDLTWKAWLVSQRAAVMAKRGYAEEAEALSLQSLQLIEGGENGEQEGRRMDRAELLLRLNRAERAQEFLPVLRQSPAQEGPHLTLAWAKNRAALRQFSQAESLVERTLCQLDAMEGNWAHMTPLIRRPAEALGRKLASAVLTA